MKPFKKLIEAIQKKYEISVAAGHAMEEVLEAYEEYRDNLIKQIEGMPVFLGAGDRWVSKREVLKLLKGEGR
jgi:hypothetical protein